MIETYLKEELINGVKQYKTYTKLTNLYPDPQNPRDISDEGKDDLKLFLTKYGRLMPFLVDTREGKEGQLIGGNKSFECASEMGWDEAWVEFRHPESDAQAFEMATIHNMEFGRYVESKLMKLVMQHQKDLDMTKLRVHIFDTTSLLGSLLRKGPGASTSPRDKDENPHEDKLNTFLSGTIRQIVLYFDVKGYESALNDLKLVSEYFEVKSNTDAFLKLIEFFKQKNAETEH